MNLNESFEKGLVTEKYIARLDYHRDAFQHIYENFTVPSEDAAILKKKMYVSSRLLLNGAVIVC